MNSDISPTSLLRSFPWFTARTWKLHRLPYATLLLERIEINLRPGSSRQNYYRN